MRTREQIISDRDANGKELAWRFLTVAASSFYAEMKKGPTKKDHEFVDAEINKLLTALAIVAWDDIALSLPVQPKPQLPDFYFASLLGIPLTSGILPTSFLKGLVLPLPSQSTFGSLADGRS